MADYILTPQKGLRSGPAEPYKWAWVGYAVDENGRQSDGRQINVHHETALGPTVKDAPNLLVGGWVAYVAGIKVGGSYSSKDEAAAAAVAWIKANK